MATFYVNKSGSDSNNCTTAQSPTPANAKLTIRAGIACMSAGAGDILIVGAGTYSETLDTNAHTIPAGTTWANACQIRVASGATVTLNGSGGSVINIATSAVGYFIIDGSDGNFIIDAQGVEDRYCFSTTNGAHHIRLKGCELKNAGASGMLISPGSQGSPYITAHEFINLHVHTNGYNPSAPPAAHGFYIATSGNLIQGCDVHDNNGYNIQLYGNNGRINNNIIERNELYGADTFGGMILSNGSGNTARNNLIRDNSGHGIEVSFDAVDTILYNNTIYDNSGYGIRVGTFTVVEDTLITNNIVYSNGSGQIQLDNETGTVQTTNLTTDPDFVNAAGGDFTLQETSDAIDAGTDLTSAGVIVDFNGLARPQGDDFDIGAFEFENEDVEMADILHDATTTDSNNNGLQNPTASHTAGVGSNGVAIISVGWQKATPPTISSVTYDGNAATSLGASVGTGSGDIKLQAFIYKNPPSGAKTVTVNFSATANDSTIRVSTYFNVDQTTSTGTVATATGSSTTPSVNVSSATGEMVVDAVVSGLNAGSTGSATVDGSQTQRANFSVSGNHRHLGSEEPGAGTTAMSWTYNATREWATIGIPLKPAADEEEFHPSWANGSNQVIVGG